MWLMHFVSKVGTYAATLGLDATEVIADCKWLIYANGAWCENVRSFSQGATQYLKLLANGELDGAAFPVPVFATPAPPEGTVPVPKGAITRITRFVQNIKNAEGYNEAMGRDLGIIGAELTSVPAAPSFKLKLRQGQGHQNVAVSFVKSIHEGVYIEGSRGPDGEWESVAAATKSPWVDTRPLLVPGQPEVRQYRLRHWDTNQPNGDWSTIGSIVVGA